MIGRALALCALTLVGSLLAGGCGTGDVPTPTALVPSGIRGTVSLGPTCPGPVDPSATQEPCVTPYSAQLAILDGEGNVVARVTSGADGKFAVDLPPGEYTVAPQNGDPVPSAQSQPVTVTAGEYTEIEINYDTGIR